MNYTKILSNINGKGIKDYDQGQQSIIENIDIHNGVCRALVIMWLTAKKKKINFWNIYDTLKEPLLTDEFLRLRDAVDLQAEYSANITSRYIPDITTSKTLGKAGLEYCQNDVIASAQEGFSQITPNDEPLKIAKHLLSKKSKFYILSISGNSGGHSIGIYKSSSNTINLFDPNVGEFEVKDIENIKTLIIQLNTLAYGNANIDLNKKYILWSYCD